MTWSRIHSNCHPRNHTHCHPWMHIHCHPWNLLSGINSNLSFSKTILLSSPTWLGIQYFYFFVFFVIPEIFYQESRLFFFYLFEKEILPGFPQSLWMTRLLSFPKSSIGNPGQIFISIIKRGDSYDSKIQKCIIRMTGANCNSWNQLLRNPVFFFSLILKERNTS